MLRPLCCLYVNICRQDKYAANTPSIVFSRAILSSSSTTQPIISVSIHNLVRFPSHDLTKIPQINTYAYSQDLDNWPHTYSPASLKSIQMGKDRLHSQRVLCLFTLMNWGITFIQGNEDVLVLCSEGRSSLP